MKKLLLLGLLATLYVAHLTAQDTPVALTDLNTGGDGATSVGSIYGYDGRLILSMSNNRADLDQAPYQSLDLAAGTLRNLVTPDPAITSNFEVQSEDVAFTEFVERNGELYVFRNETPNAIYKYVDGRLEVFAQANNLRYEDLQFSNGTAYILATEYETSRYVLLSTDGTPGGTQELASITGNRRFNRPTGQLAIGEERLMFSIGPNTNVERLYEYSLSGGDIRRVMFMGEPVLASHNRNASEEFDRSLVYHAGQFYFYGFSDQFPDGRSYGAFTFDDATLQSGILQLEKPTGSALEDRDYRFLKYEDELLVAVRGIFLERNQDAYYHRITAAGEIELLADGRTFRGPVAPLAQHRGVAYLTDDNGDGFDLLTYEGDEVNVLTRYEGSNINSATLFFSANSVYVVDYGTERITAINLDAPAAVHPSIPLPAPARFRELGYGELTTVAGAFVYLSYDDGRIVKWNPNADPSPSPVSCRRITSR